MSNNFQSWSPLKRSMHIFSNPENVHQVELFIDELKTALEFQDDVYGNVMVAITEAVNNSIVHGNKLDASKEVFIDCETLNPFRLQVQVYDQGDGFNPDALKDPTAPENLESPGGRGVFLMRHLAEEVRFEDEGRRVVMLFNI